ncbi:MAG: LPS export ABC transporter periplasmic protein LptC [Bacillati bacterium ANGP1]|uniref:LPS export ABC transporter periplasmic protein LptC n=1 Tax=Candidatus Segetimicrobium genomatis TaxID=2569760 RepID=A0A537LGF3_9BACT|nr:MAG: LPS export ABC transporter periplasmic protein LptC [Terrabacteria group bacterium ANGP1]
MGTIMGTPWRLILASGAAALAASSWGSPGRLAVVAGAVEPVPAPFVDIQGTRLTGADDAGRKQWELQAASVQIDRERNTLTLADVTGWLYRGGARQLQLHAPRATYQSQTGTVELAGGVTASAPDGRRIIAERVRWTGAHLTAAGGIVLTQPGMTVRADQMSGDVAFDWVTFEGHVAITFTPQ